jgi:hypothetical protein
VLTAGTLVGAGFAGASATIEQCMPGVYCCSLTVTSDATVALQSQIGLYNAADAYNGDNASGLYVLAQQIEQSRPRDQLHPDGRGSGAAQCRSDLGAELRRRVV